MTRPSHSDICSNITIDAQISDAVRDFPSTSSLLLTVAPPETCYASLNTMANRAARRKVLKTPLSETGKHDESLVKSFHLGNFGLKAVLVASVAFLWTAFWYLKDSSLGVSHYLPHLVDWDQRRESVRDTFIESWEAYSQDAWGRLPSGFLNGPSGP